MNKITLTVCLSMLIHVFAVAQPLRTEVHEVHWRSASDISEVLEGFLDDPPAVSETFNTLTITAPDSRHAVIRKMIERFDRPARNIELQFFLLQGSTSEGGLKNGVPAYVKEVVAEIGALTRYKSFELVDAPVLRAAERRRAGISGTASLTYSVEIRQTSVVDDPAGTQILIDYFSMRIKNETDGSNSVISTNFKIGDGETIVVGASRLGSEEKPDTAIITVVTAKIVDE